MKKPSTRILGVAFLLGASVVACGKRDQTRLDSTLAGGANVEVTAAPLSVSEIQLGKAIGADQKIVSQGTMFGVRDTIYVAIIANGAAQRAKLAARWTYNGPTVVKADSTTISPVGGESVTDFFIVKKTPWPTGAYRVEVLLNGMSAGSKDFEIR